METKEWIGSEVECDLCSHKWVAVFLAECERLECPNCGNMVTYEVIDND
jgi:DNA-directed RNA polymerase subunit RPC12/RpoP